MNESASDCLLPAALFAGGNDRHSHTGDGQQSQPQHQSAAVAGGGLAGLHGSGRLLSAAAAALAILVVVAQSGQHLALLHRDAADLADLVAGVAVLGAGDILGTHQLRVVAGSGDDLRLGVGVLLVLEGDLGGVGANAGRFTGGLGGHSVGNGGVHRLHMGIIIGAGEGGRSCEIIVPLPHRLAVGMAGGGDGQLLQRRLGLSLDIAEQLAADGADSDYVLTSYGTGAIMAVPAHDTRDWEFAKKFDLPIIEVVAGSKVGVENEAFTDCATGKLVNSSFLTGMTVEEAKKAITEWLTKEGKGHQKVNFKLRDWVFSRQRYWGEPIPIVKCDDCGYVPVPESELPLRLPMVDSYEPTDTGESPLAKMTDWVNTTCPCCGKPAKRETDTMPQWAGSSWYFLRYMDPHNDKELVSKEAAEYWSPVDWYNGGMEHTTLHLLYSRFWHKFLYDIGVVPTKEPYQKRTSHGMILGQNGEKMSKSRGNVVNPDEIVDQYGADTMRLYEMFIGDFEKAAPWNSDSIKGCKRFIERFWNLQEIVKDGDEYSPELEALMHKTIKKVTDDIDNLKCNTAIASMMTLVNEMYSKGVNKAELRDLTIILNPFAPHVTEEMWEIMNFGGAVHEAKWPEFDDEKTKENSVEIALQVKGKVRSRIVVPIDISKEDAIELAKKDEKIAAEIAGKEIKKEIYVPGKLVNIVAI